MRFLNMKTCLTMVALSAVLCIAQFASAATLPPGTAQFPAIGELGPVGGTLVATSGPVNFSIPGSYTGDLTADVYSGDLSNPNGGLTFVYTINNIVGPNSIGRMSIDGFGGWLIDASYGLPVVAGTDIAPAYIDRNPAGSVVGFSFIPLPLVIDPAGVTGFLVAGKQSAQLVLQTDAPQWIGTTASFIDGGIASASTLGPAVPEPSTIALLLTGLGAMVCRFGLRRARRNG